jgi:ABC-2 type transport system ATP-binding protein
MESVAENEITVLLSSHLISDLERVCDFLLILSNGRLQLEGSIEGLIDEHRVLVGPRRTGSKHRAISGVAAILDESVAGRQETLVVRVDGPIIDPRWEEYEVTLEDIVLAYLGQKDARPEAASNVRKAAAR